MSQLPSIKGSVFGGVVEAVRKLLDQGEVTREEILRWLEPADLSLLEQSIAISSWYPIEAYRRLNEVLRDVEGGGSNEYLREFGRQTARRLLAAGLYGQLEYLHRTQLRNAETAPKRFEAFGRDLRRLTTLSASILNFSCWATKPDPERESCYLIEVSAAADFPDVLCWRSDGFVNEMATQHGDPDLWCWDRPARDLVIFRMNRPV